MKKNENIIPHQHEISRLDRSAIKNHPPALLWFTGLSGSGKSTIADRVEQLLVSEYKTHTYLLDGDNIRKGINQDLGFSEKDRKENIRRISEISNLMIDAGLIVLTAFISPFQLDRDLVRKKITNGSFFEIFVDCPLEICESRDPKGLYKKARSGEITNFTGLTSPYQPPNNPELILNSEKYSVEECAQMVISLLKQNSIVSSIKGK